MAMKQQRHLFIPIALRDIDVRSRREVCHFERFVFGLQRWTLIGGSITQRRTLLCSGWVRLPRVFGAPLPPRQGKCKVGGAAAR